MLIQVKRCSKCILSERFPGIAFNEKGICNYCVDEEDKTNNIIEKEKLLFQLEEVIRDSKGHGDYDCIVAFSGGKDSSYTLMHLVQKYDLKCLAVTIDNDFMSEQAVKNCHSVTEALGVDFVIFKPAPDFMRNMYKVSAINKSFQTNASVKRASAICNSCINLINNYMIKMALLHNAPLVAGGYIGGQVPKDASLINLDLLRREGMRKAMLDKYNELFGKASNKFFSIREDLTNTVNGRKTIKIINPMLTLSVTEEEIIESIKKLGWVMTKDTGMNSSNCKLNDLGIAIHYKQFSFHPYELEIAEQVRNGLMSREYALKKISNIPDFSDLSKQMTKVGISVNDVK